MIRYTLFVLAVIGSAATAVAKIAPATPASNPAHITVIAKNQAFPQFGPLVIEECSVEDCSEE